MAENPGPEVAKILDSGKREQYESGMVRDTAEGKIDYTLVRDGPMYVRWAQHLTSGAIKYDKRNWMLAKGQPELDRFRESAVRHFEEWLAGMKDEDHAAATFFNINGYEYVLPFVNFDEDMQLARMRSNLPPTGAGGAQGPGVLPPTGVGPFGQY